jgi:hypothetical protein
VKKEARKESTDTPSHDTNEDVEIKKDEEVVVEKEEVEDKKDEAAGSPVVSDSDSATGESVENESPKEEENNDDFDEYEMIPQSDGITEGDIIEKRNEREIRNSSDKSVSGTKKRFIIDDDSSESDGEMNSTKPKKIKTDDVAEPLEKKSKPTITAPFSTSYQPDDDFDINCASCKKSYDMRYLDPPLTVRPSGEWRCFECLVNDARGWPRRRKSPSSSSQGKQKEEQEETSDNKRSSRRKFISSPSKKTSSRSSSSKTTSSSSKSSNNKGKSSKSKSKSKSSGSKSTFSKTRSSSSSSSKKKKHKKKKSSSSSSSSRHKSRRHHHDYAGLVSAYQSRFRERSEIQAYRETCEYEIPDLVGPRQWRVVASNTDTLRSLIKSLEGGSLGQERLRGRLIMILKEQEKIEQKMLKQQALAWQILPRRQSSRIAIEKLKYQASGEPNSDVCKINVIKHAAISVTLFLCRMMKPQHVVGVSHLG